jgi:hypothetical protein
VMCCSLWFLLLCLVLRVFFNSPTPFSPMKAGIEWCCSFVIPFLFGLKSIFQQSYPIPTYESRDWCAALLWFLSCVCLRVFFNSPTQFSPMKAGLSDVLLFCDSSLRFVLRVFFNSLTQFYLWKQDWVMCCSLWFLSLRLVLRVFFNSPTQFLPKAGIEWCAALLWFPFFVFGLKSVFSTVPPNFYLCRDWVMFFLWSLSFTFGLRVFFNSPTQFHLWKQGLRMLLFVRFLSLVCLRVFSTVPPNFLPIAGLSDAAPLWFLYVWS